jgi:hypothetical protein
MGLVVRSGASGVRNNDALFFITGWAWHGNNNKHPGHITPNLCFCMKWDLWVSYCVLVHPGHEMSTQYFSCSGGPSSDSTKGAP